MESLLLLCYVNSFFIFLLNIDWREEGLTYDLLFCLYAHINSLLDTFDRLGHVEHIPSIHLHVPVRESWTLRFQTFFRPAELLPLLLPLISAHGGHTI